MTYLLIYHHQLYALPGRNFKIVKSFDIAHGYGSTIVDFYVIILKYTPWYWTSHIRYENQPIDQSSTRQTFSTCWEKHWQFSFEQTSKFAIMISRELDMTWNLFNVFFCENNLDVKRYHYRITSAILTRRLSCSKGDRGLNIG